MEHAERVVVVGGGYIGLEIASVAVEAGRSVTVVEALPRLLSRVATGELAAFYAGPSPGPRRGSPARLLRRPRPRRRRRRRAPLRRASDGTEIPADLVVAGIGIEPVTDLARDAGIDCDNGIAVDSGCRTSAPDVFAAGDCTSHPNAFSAAGSVSSRSPTAMEQGRVAAATMLGEDRSYESEPWFLGPTSTGSGSRWRGCRRGRTRRHPRRIRRRFVHHLPPSRRRADRSGCGERRARIHLLPAPDRGAGPPRSRRARRPSVPVKTLL